MPLSISQMEATKEAPVAAVEAAPSGPSIKEMALAEEFLAAKRAAQIKAMQETAQADMSVADEPLINVAAQGREVLMERLRIHQARQEAAKEERVPPPISAKMQEKINAEIEAGRRAAAKHQAQRDEQIALRAKNPPAPEPWDTKTEVVARAGNLVPDPAKTATNRSVSGTFASGDRQYSPNV